MAKVQKRRSVDSAISLLSDDLLVEIFLKFPIRSLHCMRSFSKYWFSLIQNPEFINLHTNRPIDNNHVTNPILMLRRVIYKSKMGNSTISFTKIVITLFSDDETLPYKDDVDLNCIFPNGPGYSPRVCLLGPCNGLFCISDRNVSVIFNPATKWCRKSPDSPREANFKHVGFGFGFGFESISNDYMLVRLEKIMQKDGGGFRTVKIYSLSTNSWRDVESFVPAANVLGDSGLYRHSLFVNGVIHWFNMQKKASNNSIRVFDLNKKSFKWFKLHDQMGTCLLDVNIVVLNEALAMFVNDSSGFSVWMMMMEYGVSESWSKIIYNDNFLGKIPRILSFDKDGEFLIQNDNGKLALSNLNTRTVKEFEVEGV